MPLRISPKAISTAATEPESRVEPAEPLVATYSIRRESHRLGRSSVVSMEPAEYWRDHDRLVDRQKKHPFAFTRKMRR